MLDRIKAELGLSPRTCGADKGYEAGPFLLAVEARSITPHVAVKDGPIGGEHQEKRKANACIAARRRMRLRMQGAGYRWSYKTLRKREEAFGWMKEVGGIARTKWVGRWKLRQQFQMTAAAYNLVRMARLMAA